MKKTLLSTLLLAALSVQGQVGIEPFDPAITATYIGDFSALSPGQIIPANSNYTHEGTTGGNNQWTADDGTIIAAFTGGVGNWAAGQCEGTQSHTLVTPELDFGSNNSNPTVSFRYIMDNGVLVGAPGGFGDLQLEVVYKESVGGSWNVAATFNTIDNTWHDETVSLAGASSYSTFYVGFRLTGLSGGVLVTWGYMGLDEIVIEGEAGCTPTTSSLTENACLSYTVPSGDETYTTSGTYMDTIPNASGCDSIITVNLTVTAPDVSTSVSGITITSNATGVTYQWMDCGTSSNLSGETSAQFTATQNGSYAVIVNDGGCVDTSACETISTVGINDVSLADITRLYPNPSEGWFYVDNAGSGSIQLSVTDITGRLVHQKALLGSKNLIELQDYNPGIYFVTLNKGKERLTHKLVIR